MTVEKWLVILEGELASRDIEAMSATSDAVMEGLSGLGAEDPNTSGNVATGHFEIEIIVAGRTEAEALSEGMCLIYTAIQNGGGARGRARPVCPHGGPRTCLTSSDVEYRHLPVAPRVGPDVPSRRPLRRAGCLRR